MAFDAFLKIDGIAGESTDDTHKDWIKIESFEFETDQPYAATVISAGGGAIGCINFDHLEVSKLVDKATPRLMEFCAHSKHAREATLEVCRAGGDKLKCLEVKMENVIIAAYRSQADGQPRDGFATEEVELNFARVKWSYPQTGGWDLTANKVYA